MKTNRKIQITKSGLGVFHVKENRVVCDFLRSWGTCPSRCHELIRCGLIFVIPSCEVSANTGSIDLDPVALQATKKVVGLGFQLKVSRCNAKVGTRVLPCPLS